MRLPAIACVCLAAASLGGASISCRSPDRQPTAAGSPGEAAGRPRALVEATLAEADELDRAALLEAVRLVEEHFEGRKLRARLFAADVQSWSAKWHFFLDLLPFRGEGSLRAYVGRAFERHFFDARGLHSVVRGAADNYLRELEGLEGQLLVRVGRDIADGPIVASASPLDDRLALEIDRAIGSLAATSAGEHGKDVAEGIAIEAIAALVVESLAASGCLEMGILGGGAASGLATFGIGAVASIPLAMLIEWLGDSEARIAGEIERFIDRLKRAVVEGTPDQPGFREALEAIRIQRSERRKELLLRAIPGS